MELPVNIPLEKIPPLKIFVIPDAWLNTLGIIVENRK